MEANKLEKNLININPILLESIQLGIHISVDQQSCNENQKKMLISNR